MNNKNIEVYTIIKKEIKKLKQSGIETANLDCRLLLSKSLNRNQVLYNHETIESSENETIAFQNLVDERLRGKPVSRILNKKNFWKNDFKINDATLDPRPDSETLISAVLANYKDKSESLKILDLGSGSGCLGLSILSEYHNSEVSFLDISKKSLQAVKFNALKFGLLDRSKFIHSDWKLKDWDVKLYKFENEIKFDILISNPPYIPTEDIKTLQNEVKKYDPFIALNGGKDGLEAYRFILPKLQKIIKKSGKIFFEIGKGQEHYISSKAQEHGFLPFELFKDLSGTNRVIVLIIK